MRDIMDVLESMEDAAEKRWDEMYVDKDHYRCSCGEVTPNCEMNFLSPNPYSEPACNKCFDKYMADHPTPTGQEREEWILKNNG